MKVPRAQRVTPCAAWVRETGGDLEGMSAMWKKSLPLLSVLCALGLTAGANADSVLGFTNITNNSGIAADIGTQLSVAVSPYAGGRVLFTFENAGPDPSIIADVYFDDGSLLAIAELIDADENGGDIGVDFSLNAAPSNLPSGRGAPRHRAEPGHSGPPRVRRQARPDTLRGATQTGTGWYSFQS